MAGGGLGIDGLGLFGLGTEDSSSTATLSAVAATLTLSAQPAGFGIFFAVAAAVTSVTARPVTFIHGTGVTFSAVAAHINPFAARAAEFRSPLMAVAAHISAATARTALFTLSILSAAVARITAVAPPADDGAGSGFFPSNNQELP